MSSLTDFIVIRGHGSISALGHDSSTIFESYRKAEPKFQIQKGTALGVLQNDSSLLLDKLVLENKAYRGLDRSVLMAIYASRKAIADARWGNEADLGINIGSSRGATGLFEQYIQEFLYRGTVPPNTSPVTTLGNVSSWVAQDLNSVGPTISHSVTCSTGFQALANGFAWLKSGMANKFLAGATEAPLTPFTVAQMKSLGIYSDDVITPYPCRPFNNNKQNTFVLGEGAAVFALEKLAEEDLNNDISKLILLESIGFGFEAISSKSSISKTGNHFKLAIKNALKNTGNTLPIDMIIVHAPGTIAGDYAELSAIESVFESSNLPIITSSKWLTGHTLGASACLSLDYAIHVLNTQSYLNFPYPVSINNSVSKKIINRILITSAGFGGNAAAIIVSNSSIID